MCASESGLTQHQKGNKKCRIARDQAAGCRTREAEALQENNLRRSKRAKKSKEKVQDAEPTTFPDSEEVPQDSGNLSEDDGMVVGGGYSDADTEDTGAESD